MYNFEYLLILLVVLAVTICVEKFYRLQPYRTIWQRIGISIFFFLVAVLWDSFSVWRGHWSFSFNSGYSIGFLPLEEYLFAFVVPYFVITFYTLFRRTTSS